MITSGLVFTLSHDLLLSRQAIRELELRPELTLGQLVDRWLPAAAEVRDVAAGRDLHDWLNSLPGIDLVDVVHVNFEENEESKPALTPDAP
jgi:hypothetical protein